MDPNPETRFKIEDIKASAWYQGETAEKEEVIKELDRCVEEVNRLYAEEKKKAHRMGKLGSLTDIQGDGNSDVGSLNSFQTYRSGSTGVNNLFEESSFN